MSTWSNGHPDEGTIHAWLDDALDAAESAAVRDHVSECATCASAVAEARGLIAGASRIVRGLDDAEMTPPAAVVQSGAEATRKAAGSLWRVLRVTPSRAAIAATILVALGVFATRKELGREPLAPARKLDSAAIARSMATAPMEAPSPAMQAPSSVTGAPSLAPGGPAGAAGGSLGAMQPASTAAKDSVLQSAIRRRLAVTQPQRTLERAPGMDIPEAPARPSMRNEVQTTAPAQSAEAALAGAGVAGGRAKTALDRDSASGLASDRQKPLALRKATPRDGAANQVIQLRAAGVSPAPAPVAAPGAATVMPSGLSGDWKGMSVCEVRVPVCEDEPVVYHVIGSPSGYQMAMNRLRGTVEEYAALLQCVLTAEGMECPAELGVWRFAVQGNEMTGRFVGRDGVVVRVVRVVRE